METDSLHRSRIRIPRTPARTPARTPKTPSRHQPDTEQVLLEQIDSLIQQNRELELVRFGSVCSIPSLLIRFLQELQQTQQEYQRCFETMKALETDNKQFGLRVSCIYRHAERFLIGSLQILAKNEEIAQLKQKIALSSRPGSFASSQLDSPARSLPSLSTRPRAEKQSQQHIDVLVRTLANELSPSSAAAAATATPRVLGMRSENLLQDFFLIYQAQVELVRSDSAFCDAELLQLLLCKQAASTGYVFVVVRMLSISLFLFWRLLCLGFRFYHSMWEPNVSHYRLTEMRKCCCLCCGYCGY